MGKNGKLRKKRRLENANTLSKESSTLDDSGSDDDDTTTNCKKKTAFDPLDNNSIENAVRCLEYYGKSFDRYQASDNKVLRTSLYPLIEEQKSKFFDPAMKTTATATDSDDVEADESLHDLPSAIATFRALSGDMDTFRSKDLKELRRALYPIVMATRSAKGLKDHNINISGEISNALNLRQWDVVFRKLLEMKREGSVPKLGALQRWVRQCGDVTPKELAIFLLSRVIDLTASTTLGEQDIRQLNESYSFFAAGGAGESEHSDRPPQLVYLPPFIAAHRRDSMENRSSSALASILANTPPVSMDNFYVDSCIVGKDRRPPSFNDMYIYRNKDGAITFDRGDQNCVCHMNKTTCNAVFSSHKGASSSAKGCNTCHGVYRDDVKGVKGAMLLSNVLSPTECEQLIRSAEMLGYCDDAVEGIEALVLIANKSLLQPIFDRCKHLLPQHAPNGKTVAGINPRLRFFRYQKGAVYRPHIDGSWTANGEASLASVASDEIHSYYTFLMYLNDDFEGGGTTFFVPPSNSPEASGEAAIIAHTVQPVRGSILVFPHGVVEGSLVHEGSAVVGHGRKYVIRTDLMFS